MFGTAVQRWARSLMERLVRPLAALHVSPNAVSLAGLALNGVAALVLALGPLRVGGALVLLASAFDMVDGAVARVQQKTSVFGAFLDSTLDRYAEGMLFLGVIVHVTRLGKLTGATPWLIALTYSAAIFSLIISYTRARAESLGFECQVGLMERPERVILLGAGLVIGGEDWLVWLMAAMVVLTGITSLQRIAHVWRISRTAAQAAPAGAEPSPLPSSEAR
jgi:CDP-diacylglycerol--glycerol-3-phosphate 3-phosphatidyltransferase